MVSILTILTSGSRRRRGELMMLSCAHSGAQNSISLLPTAAKLPWAESGDPPGHTRAPWAESSDTPGDTRAPGAESSDTPGDTRTPWAESGDPPGHTGALWVKSGEPPGHIWFSWAGSRGPPGHANPALRKWPGGPLDSSPRQLCCRGSCAEKTMRPGAGARKRAITPARLHTGG